MHDFVIVCEVGVGRFKVDRYPDESSARRKAASLWCCWVLFRDEGNGGVRELQHGGVGFAHPSIRKHATTTFRSRARDIDARAQAAAAAEQRAASSAAIRPKEKSNTASRYGNDGKPDVSNPLAWE